MSKPQIAVTQSFDDLDYEPTADLHDDGARAYEEAVLKSVPKAVRPGILDPEELP